MNRPAILLPIALLAACVDQAGTTADSADHGKADSVGTPDRPGDDAFLDCWDQTFAYNTLTVDENGDTVDIELSGANVDVADFAPNDDGGWHPARVTLSIAADSCLFSADDPTLLQCGSSDVPVHVVDDFGDPVDGVLRYFLLETTHTVRTDAAGRVTESIEMRVRTTTDTDQGFYAIDFPPELDACTTDSGQADN